MLLPPTHSLTNLGPSHMYKSTITVFFFCDESTIIVYRQPNH